MTYVNTNWATQLGTQQRSFGKTKTVGQLGGTELKQGARKNAAATNVQLGGWVQPELLASCKRESKGGSAAVLLHGFISRSNWQQHGGVPNWQACRKSARRKSATCNRRIHCNANQPCTMNVREGADVGKQNQTAPERRKSAGCQGAAGACCCGMIQPMVRGGSDSAPAAAGSSTEAGASKRRLSQGTP